MIPNLHYLKVPVKATCTQGQTNGSVIYWQGLFSAVRVARVPQAKQFLEAIVDVTGLDHHRSILLIGHIRFSLKGPLSLLNHTFKYRIQVLRLGYFTKYPQAFPR